MTASGSPADVDAVFAELDNIIDGGRSDLSDAWVKACNYLGALTGDATPHLRDVARRLRRAADLADLLADATAPSASNNTGGRWNA